MERKIREYYESWQLLFEDEYLKEESNWKGKEYFVKRKI